MSQSGNPSISMSTVFQRWWPLAFSWLLMALAVPMILGVIGQMPNEEIHLAAYGSFALPVGLIFEAPILMLLAASTAMCKNRASHKRLWRFMMMAGGGLTLLHALVVFTPLADVLLRYLMDAEVDVLWPARMGLMLTLPWTWTIAYRRFHQGVLIRFGYSHAVGVGAVVRIAGVCFFLGMGYMLWAYGSWNLTGVVVGTGAHAFGVCSEALYIGLWVRPVRQKHIMSEDDPGEPPSWPEFFSFYMPLAMTSLFSLATRPLLSTGLTRMPVEMASLAVFPTTIGLVFPLRSGGMAFKEVVVALLEEEGALPVLKRFTIYLTVISIVIPLLIAATPLANLWYVHASGLKPSHAEMGRIGLWILSLIPGLTVLMNWYQGQHVHTGETVDITISIVMNLLVMALTVFAGMSIYYGAGYYWAVFAMAGGYAAQVAWLWFSSRKLHIS